MKNFYMYDWTHNPIWDAAEVDHFVDNGYRLNWSGDWIANVGSSRGIGLVVYECEGKYRTVGKEIGDATVGTKAWLERPFPGCWTNVKSDEAAARELVKEIYDKVPYDPGKDKLYNGNYNLTSVSRGMRELIGSELELRVEFAGEFQELVAKEGEVKDWREDLEERIKKKRNGK